MNAVVRLILLLTLTLSVSACSVLFPIKDEFERNSKEYGQMLRWQEFEKAAGIYVDPPLRDAYRKRIEAARDVKVVDYRVTSVDCDRRPARPTVTARSGGTHRRGRGRGGDDAGTCPDGRFRERRWARRVQPSGAWAQ